VGGDAHTLFYHKFEESKLTSVGGGPEIWLLWKLVTSHSERSACQYIGCPMALVMFVTLCGAGLRIIKWKIIRPVTISCPAKYRKTHTHTEFLTPGNMNCSFPGAFSRTIRRPRREANN